MSLRVRNANTMGKCPTRRQIGEQLEPAVVARGTETRSELEREVGLVFLLGPLSFVA